MISADYIIAGAGLTGATIARQLSDAGREVLVLEKNDHIGGNCYDEVHESGIRYSVHGPHYFRTSSDLIWEYAHRFGEFSPFSAIVKTNIDGEIYDWPITRDYIYSLYPDGYSEDGYAGFPDFEGECLKKMPRDVYERFVKCYTEKQWGKSAKSMGISLATRVEVRDGADRRLSTKKYQGIPINGYTQWIEAMLDGVSISLGVDVLQHQHEYDARKMFIFTGSIDCLFNYDLGKLQHRSQRRETVYLDGVPNKYSTCQMNYPSANTPYIREIEWKNIWPSDVAGTLITSETPVDGGEEYPIPDQGNQQLYFQYRNRVDAMPKLMVEGRLGRNRYMDMDESIASGINVAKRILND